MAHASRSGGNIITRLQVSRSRVELVATIRNDYHRFILIRDVKNYFAGIFVVHVPSRLKMTSIYSLKKFQLHLNECGRHRIAAACGEEGYIVHIPSLMNEVLCVTTYTLGKLRIIDVAYGGGKIPNVD